MTEFDNRMHSAFRSVQAESALKESARAFVQQEREKRRNIHFRRTFRPAAVFLCTLLVFFGGYLFRMYWEPVTVISIDINPSVELQINTFDRVISAEAFNDDGRDLLNTVQIRFLNYEEAVDRIITSETVTTLLARDEELVIAVVGEDENRNEKLCSNLESYTDSGGSSYCYSASMQEVKHAHSCGMSYGKYLAYQEALKQDATITEEEIRDMTMKEIRDLTEETCHPETEPAETDSHHDHTRKKHQKGHH